jgi:hypothetical protein
VNSIPHWGMLMSDVFLVACSFVLSTALFCLRQNRGDWTPVDLFAGRCLMLKLERYLAA